ncbi:hypothetical protein glysoja_037880 [Glycine soja]|uniref:Uncharacterized protein n=1 Tax=Glycine soja TaxID=3848 RepID=A0A0B2SG51_GLYSO|nr:hypothetical protein glysoja_037880 [Glycine soja]
MKASLKFREEHKKPLFRAKVPLSILGKPFQSGIVAGESKELTLNLCTFFESGPSLKVAYRPNDSKNPFSLIVKTGTGPFGSPLKSSMLMSCEFSVPGRTGSPLFMLHFKPRFGDFTFKKTQSSIFDGKGFGSLNTQNDAVELENGTVETPLMESAKVSILGDGASGAAENGLLRNAVEDLRREIVGVRTSSSVMGKSPNLRKNEKKTTSDYGNFPGKSTEAEASEKLKKALMGAAAGSS